MPLYYGPTFNQNCTLVTKILGSQVGLLGSRGEKKKAKKLNCDNAFFLAKKRYTKVRPGKGKVSKTFSGKSEGRKKKRCPSKKNGLRKKKGGKRA